jgi:hypothetical protein
MLYVWSVCCCDQCTTFAPERSQPGNNAPNKSKSKNKNMHLPLAEGRVPLVQPPHKAEQPMTCKAKAQNKETGKCESHLRREVSSIEVALEQLVGAAGAARLQLDQPCPHRLNRTNLQNMTTP